MALEARLLTFVTTLFTVGAGPVAVLGTPRAVLGTLPPTAPGTLPNTMATDVTTGSRSIALPTDWDVSFTICRTGATALVTVEGATGLATGTEGAPETGNLVAAG